MNKTVNFTASLLFLAFSTFFVSCEKEESNNDSKEVTQLLPIKIVTPDDSSNSGNLLVYGPDGYYTSHNELTYNKTIEIEEDLSSSGTYTFEIEDSNHGKIKMYATKAELKNYTLENPYNLYFEHYKNQKIAVLKVNSNRQGNNQRNFIDLTVTQEKYGSLYHIDWGDGTEEIAESPLDIESPNDRIEHRYDSPGEYEITLSTTNTKEVTKLNLQITGNGSGDKIQSLELEELSNLTSLNLGDSTMESIDDIIKQYPGLQELSARFGSLKSINLSDNSLLKLLIISGDYKTEIKGLSSLTGLEFLGITGTVEEFNPSLHPELVRLSIKGHKMNTIDVSNNTKLTALFLQSNNLKEISLNSNVNLESLYILNNDLVTIDLSNNKEIEYLNLYANYIEELDITKQEKLKYLDVSSTFLRKLTAPISLDYLEEIHLEKARFLDEEELLDAVFKGQENNSKQNGKIKFNEFAVILERQIIELQKLKEEYSWNINIPE